ncbi:MAG: hypothetical protein AAF823_10230 [Planctomycetota bacterium]
MTNYPHYVNPAAPSIFEMIFRRPNLLSLILGWVMLGVLILACAGGSIGLFVQSSGVARWAGSGGVALIGLLLTYALIRLNIKFLQTPSRKHLREEQINLRQSAKSVDNNPER